MKPIKTILLVDDDPLQREAIGRLLRGHGYTVCAMVSGEAALSAPVSPDVLLTDVQMPGVDGFTLANAFAKRCPVILMSGSFHRDAPGRLAKPFSRKKLLQAIEDALKPPKRSAA